MACTPKATNLVSEKDQEIIKGEIKEVVNIIVKGCEEANFDMAMGPWLNSPDFVYIMNGSILSYQDVVNGMKPMFDALSNQKFTMVSEKFSFLDKGFSHCGHRRDSADQPHRHIDGVRQEVPGHATPGDICIQTPQRLTALGHIRANRPIL